MPVVWLTTLAGGAPVPAKMGAVKARGLGCSSPDFSCIDVKVVDTPKPKSGQALIRIIASSINPSDVDIVEMPTAALPIALGNDFSGVVVECPSCVSIKVGDRVWGMGGTGAFGDYMVHGETKLLLAPATLDLTAAGTIPSVASTSFASLKALGAPWIGQNKTVVITSGSGGTGFIGIQLAKQFGAAHIITACSPSNADFVRSLGADTVFDYHKQDLFDALPDDSVDFVYDNYGKDGTADRASRIIRSGGKYLMMPHAECFVYATLGLPLAQKPPCTARNPKEGVTYENFDTLPVFNKEGDKMLDEIKGMFDEGKLVAHVDKVFTRNDIRAAYNYSKAGHIVGKIAVVPAPLTHSNKCATALSCTSNRSAILPHGDGPVTKFPCYEGIPEDIHHACNWDPLRRPLPKEVVCGTCADNGYEQLQGPDPIFKKVDLWGKTDVVV